MQNNFFTFKPSITKSDDYRGTITEAYIVKGGKQLVVRIAVTDKSGTEYDDLVKFLNTCAGQKSLEMDFVKAIGNFSNPDELLGMSIGVSIKVNEKNGEVYPNITSFFKVSQKKMLKGKVSRFLENDDDEDEEEITEEESSEDEEYVDESDDEDYDEEESEDEEWDEEE